MGFVTTTLTQNDGESNTDFETRVQQFLDDQWYYYSSVQAPWPIPPNYGQPGGGAYLGYPPTVPDKDEVIWNPAYDSGNGGNMRQVTYTYNNIYYYKFSGTVPPFPPAPPTPTTGTLTMWGTSGQLTGTDFAVDTNSLTVDWGAYQMKNLLDGVDPQDAVTVSQLAAASGVPTTRQINTTTPLQGGGDLSADRTLSILQAGVAQDGYLSSADWVSFNSKQPAGNYITALTGDGTASGPGSVPFTLATVNAGVGTFGSATQSAVITVNGKGLVTAASQTTITPAASSISGGQALTRNDDTNVTMTLGGTPATALLQATSMTLGWTGQLAVSRGGTGVDTASANTFFAGPTSGGAVPPAFRAIVASDIPNLSSVYQPLDADLTAIAALSPSNDDIIQRKAGAWTNRTVAQYYADLQASVKADGVFVITMYSGTFSPLDGTTYYYMSGASGVSTTQANRETSIPVGITLFAAGIDVLVAGTLGSPEDIPVVMRIDNTTDYTIKSDTRTTAVNQHYSVPGLSQAVPASSRIQIKSLMPTFATNPTNVIYLVNLYFRYT